jgi:hypothetical protein
MIRWSILFLMMSVFIVHGFQPSIITNYYRDGRMIQQRQAASIDMVATEPSREITIDDEEEEVEIHKEKNIINQLREELIDIGERTERGFKASKSDRERVQNIIFELAQYNKIKEPVRTYYGDNINNSNSYNDSDDHLTPSIQGKWKLIYTDAPDITGLGIPSPFVTLGRIGQDCSRPPYITNVIEWCSPSWANKIPFLVGKKKLDTDESASVLQKVVTYASAVPSSPTIVNLNVAGLQVATYAPEDNTISSSTNVRQAIEDNGLITGLVKQQQGQNDNVNIIKLDEAQQPPFGSFDIVYLDENFRITKTNRNHYTINVRIQPDEEWF